MVGWYEYHVFITAGMVGLQEKYLLSREGPILVVDLDSPEPDHRLHRASSWEAPLLSWFDSSYMSIFTGYRLRST